VDGEASRNGNPRTRQALIDALSRLLETRPLEEVSVAEILSAAGHSSRTTFYKHFATRDEAFIALADDTLQEVRKIVDTVVRDRTVRRSHQLRQAVSLWMQRAARHRGLTFSIISEWPRIPQLKEIYLRFMADLVADAATAIDEDRDAGLVCSSLPSDRLAAMVLWSAERAVYATLINAEGFTDADAVADVLVAMHLATIYGVDLPADARRAPWLTTLTS
jgi:AcrR family transcriptional regulator